MSDQSTADSEASEGVEETLDELSETVEKTDEGDSKGKDAGDEIANIDALIDRAMDDIEALLTAHESDDPFEEVREDLDDLIAVIEEIEELLETIDLTDLPEAVDVSELPAAIEAGEVPNAIAEGDPGEAVKYRKLLQIVELGELWNAVDVREFWRNKRELDDAAADVTDSGDDENGPIEKLRSLGGDDRDDSDTDAGGESSESVAGTEGGMERDDIEVPSETIQQRVQSKLSDAVGEFRESLLDSRERIEALKEENEARTGDVEQPDSRNPTAYSSIPSTRTDMSGTTAFSTVPEETRYSSAPNRPRLYGSRLDRAAEEHDE
ncbi:hypothetical protein [Halococcus saccharolyticus]|uniref:Uncharacterized protein n=1 Tax=Halococcus saccharolyticus DSM 5350 TaxID=1227455 RepID=M0MMG7_9EURY|nr:hypothetical protein [Halococcus saccharolyticus]EMA46538.1 hypothetical protein C449_04295 [Halococcus saccharolyticus DSM 5350]